ncbi:protein rep [Pseudonocardia sp. RS010]|uniref:protein rep n=1 Tax=Pseudonocardia sp. RS010 TaxID=3385979 RepID=UPI00399F8789
MRRRLWELSTLPGVRKCGRVSRTEAGGPVLRVSGAPGERVAGYAGLVSCGVMTCPVCASKVGARRAEEIGHVVDQVHAAGGSAALVTLTLRHHKGHRLREVWDALTYAWSRVSSGKAYAHEWQTFGITGWLSAVEVTHGDAGWHPHRHILVLFDSPMSQDMVTELSERWFLRWERALARRGFTAVADKGGLDARVVARGSGSLGVYLSKIAHEVSGSPTKQGRGGSRTPFQIFRDFLATGNADDYDLWTEYEQTAHRRRTLTWSQGTRERYGVGEQTDEEIAQEDMGGDDTIGLPNETWRVVRHQAEALLEVAERDGPLGAAVWLTDRRLSWSWVSARARAA